MNILKSAKAKIGFITILSVFLTPSVYATGFGGSLMPVSVPALSGPMLIVLSLLLFVIAIKITKQNNTSKFMIALVGVTALAFGGGGAKLVSNTYAGVNTQAFLVPSTTTFSFLNMPADPNSGFNGALINESGQAITIQSLEPHVGSSCQFVGLNMCNGIPIPLTSPLTMPDETGCEITCSAINGG